MFRRCGLVLFVSLLVWVPPVMAQEDPQLDGMYSGGGITFHYPADWLIQEDAGSVILANSQQALDAIVQGTSSNPQDVALMFSPSTAADLYLPAGATALDVVNSFVGMFGGLGASLAPPTETTLSDLPFAYTSGNFDQGGLLVGAVQIETDRFEVIMAVTGSDITQHQPTLLAIINTLTFDSSALPASSSTSTAYDVSLLPGPVPGTGQVAWVLQSESNYEGRGFNGSTAVSVGPDDMIYVAQSPYGILQISPDGVVQRAITPAGIYAVHDFALAADGTFWIADPHLYRIVQIDADGNILTSFGEQGSEAGQFGADSLESSPAQVEIGPDGNLYVLDYSLDAESNANPRIEVFDTAGTILREFPLNDATVWNLETGIKIAFGPDGRLYAADFMGHVSIFDPQGHRVTDGVPPFPVIGEFPGVGGWTIGTDGSVYVGSYYSMESGEIVLFQFDQTGALVTQFGQRQAVSGTAFEPGQYFSPEGIALLSNGDLVIIDSNTIFHQIVRVHWQ